MGYEAAIGKAWEELEKAAEEKVFAVRFLADTYTIDRERRSVISEACNIPAKDFTGILILHYLLRKIQGLPKLEGEWVAFKELSGIEGYGEAFRKRSIEPILRKYGKNPDGLLEAGSRYSGRRLPQGDVGVAIDAFEGVPVAVLMWRCDDEFGPEANILFDRSLPKIFCTEDIVVLAGIVAGAL